MTELQLGNVSIGSGPDPRDDMCEVTLRQVGNADEDFVIVRAMFRSAVNGGDSVDEAQAAARARAHQLFQQCADLLAARDRA